MAPWATLGAVALNVALFWRPARPPDGCCLSAQAVWGAGQWRRLLLAPLHHLSAGHLALNMAGLLWLGSRLERAAGGPRTAALLLLLALLGGLLHLALNAALAAATGRRAHWEHCALGFSGVLFSLEAMGSRGEPFPGAWLCVLECLLLAVVHPRSSVTGHISGILAGLALAASPLHLNSEDS